jgi:RHS repeat-associated protein
MPFPELLSLSPCTRQRFAGWFCVLSYVWVAMAPLAHAGRVLPLEGACRHSCHDANGNRSAQRVTDLATAGVAVTSYAWDAQDRLSAVVMPDGGVYGYEYDYRTRRIGITRAGGGQADQGTTVVFSGGLSLAEWEEPGGSLPTQIVNAGTPTVEYHRGPDMGGGVGGLLYSLRGSTPKYNLSNGRGDVVAQSNAAGEVTWTASYEAYGKRTKETGANADKQRANTKDEDPTGLLNEGFRYRDLETGVWLSRDPAGFVDGPNLYAYVQQNPWSKFDAEGMFWSALVTAGFAAYDTYQYATGQTSGAEYSKAMALNGAALLADVSTGGMGGGLALRALNAGVKVAKAVDKANNIVETAQAAVETTENIVSAVQEGDGRGVMRAAGAGILGAITDRAMGKKGGAHRDTTKPSRDGLESHHMPADSINGIPTNDGPAIKMDPADHAETSSWGSGRDAEIYREGIQKKINGGDMRGAMADEIRDVRRAAQEVSGDRTKYNSGMREMMNYAREKKSFPKTHKIKLSERNEI